MSVKNAQGQSVNQNNVRVPDVPNPPSAATATDVGTSRAFGNGAASVAVTPDTSYWGSTITGYTVTASPGGASATGSSPVTVAGLSGNSSYTFSAKANNATGSSASVTTSSTAITTVPDVPTSVVATNQGSTRPYNNGQASVAFTAGNNGGKSVSSFTVTSSPGGLTGTGATSPIVVTGLTSATAYTYTVTGTNANGTSSASSASAAVTATTVPQAPTIGTFTDGGTGTTGTLSFTAGATGGSAITNYKTSTDNSTFTALSPAQTTSPLSLTGLTVGTATYYIKAVNANGDSSASSGVSGTVIQPTSFESIATATATAGQTSITFSSIPQTYSSLQIRGIAQSNASTLSWFSTFITVQVNSTSTTNYTSNHLFATSTSAGWDGSTAINGVRLYGTCMPNDAYYSNMRSALIVDIHDYTNATRNKTIRYFSGANANLNSSNFGVSLGSGFLTNSTSAITSITLVAPTGQGYTTGTSFALYGIKE